MQPAQAVAAAPLEPIRAAEPEPAKAVAEPRLEVPTLAPVSADTPPKKTAAAAAPRAASLHHAIPEHAAHLPGLPMDEVLEPDRFDDLFQQARRVITPEIIERRRRARRLVLFIMVAGLAILSLAALIYLWRHAAARRRAAIESQTSNPELYAAAPQTAAPQPAPSVVVTPAEPVAANPPAVEAPAEPAASVPAEASSKAQVHVRPGRVSQPAARKTAPAAPAREVQEATPAAKFEAEPARTE
jgi:hypothetical protein